MKGRVTVIDDDLDLRSLLQIALRFEGYQVTTYSNGDEFVREIDIAPSADIYIIDINLGGLTGFDLCKRIKANSSTKNAYVMLISANPEVQQHAQDSMADDYMLKPFSQKDLMVKLKTLNR
jgi:two-component system, OmpR family, response regulator MprA